MKLLYVVDGYVTILKSFKQIVFVASTSLPFYPQNSADGLLSLCD